MGVWAPRSGQKNDSKSINQSINQEIVNFCSIKKILKLLRDNIVLLIRCEKLRNSIQNEHASPLRARIFRGILPEKCRFRSNDPKLKGLLFMGGVPT